MKHTASLLVAMLSLALLTPLASADADMDGNESTYAAPSAPSALGEAVSDETLSSERGRATITNINDLDGAVYNNVAQDIVTGSNFIADGSLTANSGLATVIQNSGNNVLIQNAFILNIQVQ